MVQWESLNTHNELNTVSAQVSHVACPLSPGIIAIAEINEALNSGDHQQTLAALLLPTAKLTGVNPATAKHYHDVLQYTKELLCQVIWHWFCLICLGMCLHLPHRQSAKYAKVFMAEWTSVSTTYHNFLILISFIGVAQQLLIPDMAGFYITTFLWLWIASLLN